MNEPKVEEWLHTSVGIINERIYEYSKQHVECNGMGTTLIIAICTPSFVTIGHIGIVVVIWYQREKSRL